MSGVGVTSKIPIGEDAWSEIPDNPTTANNGEGTSMPPSG